MTNHTTSHPLASLPHEDLDLIAEFVARDGSLKALAAAYGVSYPTIRARFTRLVERTTEVMAGRTVDPLSELLASLVERGELSPSAARAIRTLVPREASQANPQNRSTP